METFRVICQIVIGVGLLNVWLLRPAKKTSYRGGGAKDMQEEFEVYGLPNWALWLVGGLKVLSGAALIVGIWMPELVVPAAAAVTALMFGAVVMHLKVKDPVRRAMPAAGILALSLLLIFTADVSY